MAFQRVPNTAEVDVEFLLNNVVMQNTFYGEKVGGYDLPALESLASEVDVAVGLHLIPLQSSDGVYTRTVVRGLDLENDLVAEDNDNAGSGGTVFSAMPANVTLAVKRASAFTGRSARGRIFWCMMPRDALSLDDNFVEATYGNDVADAINEIALAINSAGWVAVIVSRFAGGVKRAEGVTFPWLTTSVTDLRVDSRRDRLP